MRERGNLLLLRFRRRTSWNNVQLALGKQAGFSKFSKSREAAL
jgi:hypothetical protein